MSDDEGLLAAIARADVDARQVYADWLEEQGDTVRAAFVRAQEQLAGPRDTTSHFDAMSRTHDLADETSVEWRMRVARSPVVGCDDSRCALDWGQLVRTDETKTRRCGACNQPVHYVTSDEERARLATQRRRVAVDAALLRPRLTLEHLADLPETATWQVYALALVDEAEVRAIDPMVPESLAVLLAGNLDTRFTIAEGDESEVWSFDVGDTPGDYIARYLSEAMVFGQLRTFAILRSGYKRIVAAFEHGDPDATLHRLTVWDDEPIVETLGTVRDFMAGLFNGYGIATLATSLQSRLRDLVVRAIALRETLRDERRVRVAAIEKLVGMAGTDEAELMEQWERAGAELARVERTPPAWSAFIASSPSPTTDTDS